MCVYRKLKRTHSVTDEAIFKIAAPKSPPEKCLHPQPLPSLSTHIPFPLSTPTRPTPLPCPREPSPVLPALQSFPKRHYKDPCTKTDSEDKRENLDWKRNGPRSCHLHAICGAKRLRVSLRRWLRRVEGARIEDVSTKGTRPFFEQSKFFCSKDARGNRFIHSRKRCRGTNCTNPLQTNGLERSLIRLLFSVFLFSSFFFFFSFFFFLLLLLFVRFIFV